MSTSQNNDVTIRISDPAFAMLSAGVDMRFFEYLSLQGNSTLNRSIELICLKPEKHTIPIGFQLRVPHVLMLVSIPVMKLKDDFAIAHEALVFPPAVPTLAIQQMTIPAATRFDVVNRDKGLRMHTRNLVLTPKDQVQLRGNRVAGWP